MNHRAGSGQAAIGDVTIAAERIYGEYDPISEIG
jgi:hypothetical protein